MSFKGSKEIIEAIENKVMADLAIKVLEGHCINDPTNPVIQEVYDHFEKYYKRVKLKDPNELTLFGNPFPEVWEILDAWKAQ